MHHQLLGRGLQNLGLEPGLGRRRLKRRRLVIIGGGSGAGAVIVGVVLIITAAPFALIVRIVLGVLGLRTYLKKKQGQRFALPGSPN